MISKLATKLSLWCRGDCISGIPRETLTDDSFVISLRGTIIAFVRTNRCKTAKNSNKFPLRQNRDIKLGSMWYRYPSSQGNRFLADRQNSPLPTTFPWCWKWQDEGWPIGAVISVGHCCCFQRKRTCTRYILPFVPVQVTVHFVKFTVFCAYFRTDIPIPDKSFIPPKCQIPAKRWGVALEFCWQSTFHNYIFWPIPHQTTWSLKTHLHS